MRIQYVKAGLLLMLAMLSAACSKFGTDAAAAHSAVAAKSTPGAAKPGAAVDPDLVSAVSAAGNSTTPISMKFKLSGRPAVNAPLQLIISIIPAADVPISHIRISFQPSDGLQLQSARSIEVSDPSPATPIQQELALLPQQTGVLSLSATVLVDTDTGSISRYYSIPLIVSDSHS